MKKREKKEKTFVLCRDSPFVLFICGEAHICVVVLVVVVVVVVAHSVSAEAQFFGVSEK